MTHAIATHASLHEATQVQPAKIFILRNYNSFVTGTKAAPKWENFGLHRFENDFARLLKFNTQAEGLAFISAHPALESEFDAWCVETEASDWANIAHKY